jgi:peptidoglycan/LPS O-acetylase OafA/YrhL
MTPVSSEPTPSRIAGFDGLRAIAVTLVILWHVPSVLYFPRALLGPLGVVSSIGWIGVDLFFVLSGYLITTLLLREEAQSPSGRFSMGGFYLRRSLRILPAFVAVMALNYTLLSRHPLFTSVGVGAVIAHNDWRQLTAFALFLGNYWGPYAWRLWRPVAQVGPAVGVTWSLCVEEHFYLLWPMLLRAFPRARLHLALSTCVLVLGVRYVVAAVRLDHHVALHLATHYRIDSILWGAALALYSATRPMPGARVRRTALALLGGLTALCVATGHLGALPRSTPLGHSLGLTLLAPPVGRCDRGGGGRPAERPGAGPGGASAASPRGALVRGVSRALLGHRSDPPRALPPSSHPVACCVRLRLHGDAAHRDGPRHGPVPRRRATLPGPQRPHAHAPCGGRLRRHGIVDARTQRAVDAERKTLRWSAPRRSALYRGGRRHTTSGTSSKRWSWVRTNV